MTTGRPEDRIELRLALVCYGGVSLAVYMHGVTKELHKLARASRRFDDVDEVHRGAQRELGASYASYCRLKAGAAARRMADEVARRFVWPACGECSRRRAA